jgi:hypothetical protein
MNTPKQFGSVFIGVHLWLIIRRLGPQINTDKHRYAASLLALLSALPLIAAVEGTVTNGSTGAIQPNATVTLFKLDQTQGLTSIESVKSDAAGKFTINQTLAPGGPHLVQTAWDGVTFNHMLPPGRPTTGLQLQVFNTTSKRPEDTKIAQHMMVLEPNGSTMTVSERYFFTNTGKFVYNDSTSGTLRFYLPDAAGGKVDVKATAPQGLPIARVATKSKTTPGLYYMDFPVKPGDTEFELTYTLPMTDPGTFPIKIAQADTLTFFVAPPGVELAAAELELRGREPKTQATVYHTSAKNFKIEIKGTGALDTGEEEAPPGAEEEGEGVRKARPPLYDNFPYILGLAALILILGFIMLQSRREGEALVSKKGQRK